LGPGEFGAATHIAKGKSENLRGRIFFAHIWSAAMHLLVNADSSTPVYRVGLTRQWRVWNRLKLK